MIKTEKRFAFAIPSLSILIAAVVSLSGCGGGGGNGNPVTGPTTRLRTLQSGDSWSYTGTVLTDTGSGGPDVYTIVSPATWTIYETGVVQPGISPYPNLLHETQKITLSVKQTPIYGNPTLNYYLTQDASSGDIEYVADAEDKAAATPYVVEPGMWNAQTHLETALVSAVYASSLSAKYADPVAETVTVPAGTFSTWKVHYTFSAITIPAVSSSGEETWTQDGTFWWAPTIGRWVKADFTDSYHHYYQAHFELTATNVPITP